MSNFWPSVIRNPQYLIWLLIMLFALLFSTLALNRHAAFESNGFDLGNVNQAIWNTAQGRPLAFTNMAPVTNRLALHVEPILFLFVPFYWLGWGGPELLLVVQASVVAWGAWPLYLLGRSKLGAGAALVISLAYLLYPALEAALLFDFHAVALAPTFLLFAFYQLSAVSGQRSDVSWRKVAVWLLLAMACKEDVGLIVAMMGLYWGLTQRRWRAAGLIFGGGLAWSLIAIVGIQGTFGGNVQGNRYDWLVEAVWQPELLWAHLWQRVDLLSYVWGMFAPVGGLALLAPLALLPTLPSLVINLLSSQGLTWRLEEFHYAAPMAPFIFVATIKALERLTRNTQHATRPILLILLLATSLTYHHFRGFTPLARPFQWRTVTAHHQLGREIAAQIPPDVPLFAPLNLNPHVSSRSMLHQTFDSITPGDWLWLDVASLPNENGIQQFIRDSLLPAYQIVQAEDGYLLLKPGGSFTSLPDTFHTYARPQQPVAPQYPLTIRFGEGLRLVGYDLRFNRAEAVQVRTYWQADTPLPADLRPTLYLLDEAGAYLGALDEAHTPATLVWYPTQLWPLGETMVVDFSAVNWHTRDRRAYWLAVGVVAGADPWAVGARWSPSVIAAAYAPYHTPDGSVIELAYIERVAGLPVGGPLERQRQPTKMTEQVEATFADQVRLVGYNQPTVRQTGAGSMLDVSLLWQAAGGSTRPNLVRFVHLVGPDGVLLAQQDSAPLQGRYPTSLWEAGEYVFEDIVIPLAAAPSQGSSLHVGLYDPASTQRLLLPDGADHWEIGIE